MGLTIEYVDINSIVPYANNAKIHTEEQIEQIKTSIQEFGMNDPIGVWNNEVVEGHGRLLACKELGYEQIPIIRLDDLSDEQRKAYALVHNALVLQTGFDAETLERELENIEEIDMSKYDFETEDLDADTSLDEMFLDEPVEKKRKNRTVVCPCCGKVIRKEDLKYVDSD